MKSFKLFLLSLSVGLVLFSGCEKKTPTSMAPMAPIQPFPSSKDPSEVLATVNDVKITYGDIKDKTEPQLADLKEREYSIMSNVLNDVISQKLLEMEAGGKNIGAFLEEKAKTMPLSEQGFDAFYTQMKDRIPGTSDAEKKERAHLIFARNQIQSQKMAYLAELRKKNKVEVLLKAPERPKVDVEIGDSPSKGKKNAKVTIIEFSDFQCPYCKRAADTLKPVLEKYKDKVRFVHKSYPLPFHQDAMPTALAAACANAQGKFWEFYDKLFTDPSKLKREFFIADAKAFKLNEKKFTECFDKATYQKDIESEIAYGKSVGVSSTPTYFINGILSKGARPAEYYEEMITRELAQQ